jgi:hypothetical protein
MAVDRGGARDDACTFVIVVVSSRAMHAAYSQIGVSSD